MRIRKIRIQNVRGISSLTISADLHPNNPIFFVAPNGFGKTSIATAFNSVKRSKIELQDDDMFQNNQTLLPELELTDDVGNVYLANSTSNTISTTFSIFVINSLVKPKATTLHFGNHTTATPSLSVEPIVLYKSIPSKCELAYSYTQIKQTLGQSAGKLLINLTQTSKSPDFIRHLKSVKEDFARLLQARNSQKITQFLAEINLLSGSKTDICNHTIPSADDLDIESVRRIQEEFNVLFHGHSINEILVNIIQLRELYCINEQQLTNIFSYYEYLTDRAEINEMLSFFNCTWKNIRAAKKGEQFVIEFPKANQISNGERDVLCFIGKLFEARSKLRKDKAILIIDEIFDYLDDANLIAAQYFLTKFISQFKKAGKELYPIILTHLDPLFFNTYSFSIKNVTYLDRVPIIPNKHKINNMLKDRDNCKKHHRAVYDCISKNYLHYSIGNADEAEYLRTIGVEDAIVMPEDFRRIAQEELDNYRHNRDYDPAFVCCGLRILIEKNTYEQLRPEFQPDYFTKFKTTDKLAYAKEMGVSVPEVYFLLSIIYNEAMHLDAQCQKLNPIACKLRNKVIHNMISEI